MEASLHKKALRTYYLGVFGFLALLGFSAAVLWSQVRDFHNEWLSSGNLFKKTKFEKAVKQDNPSSITTSEVVLFPDIKKEERKEIAEFAALDARTRSVLSRKTSLDMAHAFPPFKMIYPFGDRIDDFEVRPLEPVLGSLYATKLSSPSCIKFKWTTLPFEGTRYILQVSKGSDFKYFKGFGSDRGNVQVKIAMKGDYFWRVKAEQGHENLMSSIMRFTVKNPTVTAEEERIWKEHHQIRDQAAWFADMDYCEGGN